MNPKRITWDESKFDDKFIDKELKEVFPQYLAESHSVYLVSKVSGVFYTDIYQFIDNEILKYAAYNKHYKRQTIVVLISAFCVLSLLCIMLYVEPTILFLQFSATITIVLFIFSLIVLGIDIRQQIYYYNAALNRIQRLKIIFHFRHVR
jgi:hypothetical protein